VNRVANVAETGAADPVLRALSPLIASLPAGQHVVLADTTHAMNQERPAELAEAIISLAGR
jgi:pimeloyl-ACP methyl ester carboxylesterase